MLKISFLFSILVLNWQCQSFVVNLHNNPILSRRLSSKDIASSSENVLDMSGNSSSLQTKVNKKERYNAPSSLSNMTMQELAAPLLDQKFLQSILAEMNRPLPHEYLLSPLVIVGPSGVGKNRLVKTLLKDYGRFFRKVVTHTTRRPRHDEVNGTTYHFVSKELFLTLQATPGYFVETATVHNNLYGLSFQAWQQVRQSGVISIMEVDIQGAESIFAQQEALKIKPNFMFIAPPTIEGLRIRLQERGTETVEEVNLRIKNAEIEMNRAQVCKFFGRYLVNDDIYRASDAFYRFARDW